MRRGAIAGWKGGRAALARAIVAARAVVTLRAVVGARAVVVGARAVVVGARAVVVGARAVDVGARAVVVGVVVGGVVGATSCGPAVRAPTANQAPVPVLVVQASARVGEAVHVDGNGSTDIDGAVSDSFLLFGDGSDPVIGFEASHTFTAPGLYLVELYIDDDKGATARARSRIEVTP